MITTEKETKTAKQTRLIFHVKGNKPGPTIVFFAGIHGNETAGVKGLKNCMHKFNSENVNGNIYGIYGNSEALKLNKRFIDTDLNRIWTTDRLKSLGTKEDLSVEEAQQKELYRLLLSILENNNSPIYFIDFHTTSSKTLPFITINDALINRKFSKCFPVPIVLGIEEYLEGPLLSYLNKLGYVSLGFEAGQHEAIEAVSNCESFIYLTVYHTGSVILDTQELQRHHELLAKAATNNSDVYEVVYKHHIKSGEDFKMMPGFESFQHITKGIHLANSDGLPIYSDYNNQLFMPLYQKRGNDGFFIIRKIAPFFLWLSGFLRKIKADNVLILLPGITWHNKTEGVLKANLKVARFMAKSIFHLLGYRNKQKDKSHLLLYNRERVAKNNFYKKALWNK